MFSKYTTPLALFTILLFSPLTFSAANNAQGYETLAAAQPTQDPQKIEVIEFFWYGCPHCYSFEPLVHKWLENKPKNVQFIRQPAIFSKLWGKHAKAYFTAEALDVVDKVHTDFFNAIQNQKKKLQTEDQLVEFFSAYGVKEQDFKDAYNSFFVDTKMRQAKEIQSRYGLQGVPAIIVNGKYKVTAKLAGSQEQMINVVNQLIAQESAAQ